MSFCIYAQNITNPVRYKQAAECWANQTFVGTIDQGKPYYFPDNTIAAWIFTVYRNSGVVPKEQDILKSIEFSYQKRIKAEESFDKNLIRYYWKQMTKEIDFATIMVMGSPENPYVAAA